MESQTVTIEVAPQLASLLRTLQQRAEEQGKTLYAFLREAIKENENAAELALAALSEENGAPALTPYELVEDLIGSVDSSLPEDPEAPPHRPAMYYFVAEKLRKQGLKIP
jgi:hypothetical protein